MSLDFGEDVTCFSVTRLSLLTETTSAWSFLDNEGSFKKRWRAVAKPSQIYRNSFYFFMV